jgi:hypothetical protein
MELPDNENEKKKQRIQKMKCLLGVFIVFSAKIFFISNAKFNKYYFCALFSEYHAAISTS